ncbi:hypothetical protein BDW75DRAFT_201740 [Aspergillus navahoensis]
MSLPTIVLVHGAWHTPANYAHYADALRTQGFTVHCPLLPTCNKSLPGQPCLNDDIKLVRDLVSSLTNTGHRILMIMHSYGGAVGTEAVQGLAYPIRASTDGASAGGVIHLVYLCAYILPPATRIWDIVAEAGFERVFDEYVHTDEQDGSTFPRDPALMFFGGDPTVRRETIDSALGSLVRFPRSALLARTGEGPAWRFIPATYVITGQDYGVPKIYQEIMLRKVKEAGVEIRLEEFDTCHSVFISRESEMVRVAVEAAELHRP